MNMDAKQKLVTAFDDILKGAIALVVTAVATRVIDNTYDKYVVARRTVGEIDA